MSEASDYKLYITLFGSKGVSVADAAYFDAWGVIDTGANPAVPAISRDGMYVFVPVFSGDTLQVVDTVRDEVIKDIKVGKSPYQAYATPDGRYIMVCNSEGNSVTVVDAGQLDVVKTINLDLPPFQIKVSPDSKTAYVVTARDKMYLIDITSLSVVAEPGVPEGIYSIALSPGGEKAYLLSPDNVTVLSADGSKVLDVLSIGGTQGIEVSPDGKELWLGSSDPEKVLVYSLAEERVVRELPRDTDATYIQITFSPDGSIACILPAGENYDKVYVYDVKTKEYLGKIDLADYPRGLVYVTKKQG